MSYASEVLTDSPLAYYRVDEAADTIMADSSGNGRDGTYTSSSILGAASLIASAPGNDAILLSGGQYAYVDIEDWQNGAHTTLECWFSTTLTGDASLITRWGGYAALDLQSSDVVRFYCNVGGSTKIASTPVPGLRDGQPHHILGTYDGSNLRIYVDGAEVASLAASGSLSSGASVGYRFGSRFASPSSPFSGTLDEIAIYDHALSSERVLAHYDAGTAPPAAASSVVIAGTLPALVDTLVLTSHADTSTRNQINGRRRSGYALVADNTDPVTLPDDNTERRDKVFWYPTPTLVDGRPT